MIVSKLPLDELTSDRGPAVRIGELDRERIRDLLRTGAVRFVVANIGKPMRWIEAAATYEFWKTEALPHLADEESARLEEFPDEYCYFASQWRDEAGVIVVLAMSN